MKMKQVLAVTAGVIIAALIVNHYGQKWYAKHKPWTIICDGNGQWSYLDYEGRIAPYDGPWKSIKEAQDACAAKKKWSDDWNANWWKNMTAQRDHYLSDKDSPWHVCSMGEKP